MEKDVNYIIENMMLWIIGLLCLYVIIIFAAALVEIIVKTNYGTSMTLFAYGVTCLYAIIKGKKDIVETFNSEKTIAKHRNK